MNINNYIKLKTFSENRKEKDEFFKKSINLLTLHHYKKSYEYKKILDFLKHNFKKKKLNEIPFLPARLFKEFELKSIPKKKIFKIFTFFRNNWK